MSTRRAPRAAGWLILALVGCGGGEADSSPSALRGALTVTDADGRTLHLAGPAERIVSLVPSATLTLAALGAQSSVVARTDFDTAAWIADRPSVGGGLQPSIESLAAVRPDLVIRFGGPQDTRTPARLDDLGIEHIAIRPDGVKDVLASIELIGRVSGRTSAADSLVAHLTAQLEEIRRSAQGQPAVRVAYILGGEPPWVAGPGTYIHELIELAGGTNVFADLPTLYTAVGPEEVLARRVDVFLTGPGEPLPLRLTRGARVVTLGGDVELPGPGVAEAARQVAAALRGSRVP